MPVAAHDFDRLLAAIAEFRGYRYPERVPAWKKRLATNATQVAAFAAAPGPAEPSLLAMPEGQPKVDGADRFDFSADRTRADAAPGITGIAALVNSGAASVVDITSQHLDRIDAHRDLNAFITVQRDRVMKDAEMLAASLRAGRRLPLAGVPIAVKDAVRVKGYPMTCGTKVIAAAMSEDDAEAVKRLRDAGAIIIGTTNLDELGYAATGLHGPYGRIVNPKARNRIAGGSSGGSAVAVAANLAAGAIGTDTGGALRVPASCCGIVGLKPTHGAISSAGYAIRAPSLDSLGPMTRSVTDCALMYEVMAGLPVGSTLGRDPVSAEIRVGRPENFFFEDVDPDDLAIVGRAIDLVKSAKIPVDDVRIADLEHSPAVHFITVAAEATEMFAGLLTEQGPALGEDLRARLEVGQFIFATDFIKAQRFRNHLRRNFLDALSNCDVIVTPTLQMLPPEIDEGSVSVAARASSLMGRFTGPLNATGLPGVTIPCGTTSSGAPVGLQLIGRPGDEGTLLRAAFIFERILTEHTGAPR